MSRLLSLAINENGFAFDPLNGESYNLNESASEIIDLLKRGNEIKEVAITLATSYDISFEEAYTDLLDFKQKLKLYSLI